MDRQIEKIKDLILENNYFDTLAGQRFRDWNDLKDISAVISFSGRSRKGECFRIPESGLYVTHLYIDRNGDVMVQVGKEDTDDFGFLLRPSGRSILTFDEETLDKWIELLTF